MSPNEIEVGKTYHNGKTGNRSYSARKVLRRAKGYGVWNIEYEQIAGKFKGQTFKITAQSFGRWAKGEVGDTNA